MEINVSSPIVPFRESIIDPPKVDRVNEEIVAPVTITKPKTYTEDSDEEEEEEEEELGDGLIEICTPNKQSTVQIRAKPLPSSVTQLLEENTESLRTLQQYMDARIAKKSDNVASLKLNQDMKQTLIELREKLWTALEEGDEFFKGAIDQIWSFGPRQNGPNILLNRIEGYDRLSIWSCLDSGSNSVKLRRLDHSIVSGFQLATLAGPMCEEPLMRVCFSVEKWDIEGEEGLKTMQEDD